MRLLLWDLPFYLEVWGETSWTSLRKNTVIIIALWCSSLLCDVLMVTDVPNMKDQYLYDVAGTLLMWEEYFVLLLNKTPDSM